MLKGVIFGSIGAVMGLLLVFILQYKRLYENTLVALGECKNQNSALIATLENKKLKLKEYLEQKPKMEKKIITKYKIIKQKDEDCQSFKEGVYEILNVFYSHPPP